MLFRLLLELTERKRGFSDFLPIRGQEGDLRLADKLTQTEVTLAGLARFRTEMIVDQS